MLLKATNRVQLVDVLVATFLYVKLQKQSNTPELKSVGDLSSGNGFVKQELVSFLKVRSEAGLRAAVLKAS
jgi:hypothetical protein